MQSSLPTSVKDKLLSYCQESSLHGFRNIVHAGLLRRFLWLLLLSVATTALVIQIRSRLLLFINPPHVTNVQVEHLNELDFPVIAFCSGNQMKLLDCRIFAIKISLFRMNYLYDNGMVEFIRAVYENESWEASRQALDAVDPKLKAKLNNLTSYQFFVDAAPRLKDMLLSCSWPNGSECGVGDFWQLSTDFGICYAINDPPRGIDDVATTKVSGINGAMRLLLNVEAYDTSPGRYNIEGAKVVLFEQHTIKLFNAFGLDVPTKMNSLIGVRKNMRRSIPRAEGGTCVDQWPLEYYPGGTYTVDKCRMNNLVARIVDRCNCTPSFYHRDHSLHSQCSAWEHYSCSKHLSTLPAPAASCPEECFSIEYRTSFSFSRIPEESIRASLSQERLSEMKRHYFNALEATHRSSPGEVARMNNLIAELEDFHHLITAQGLSPLNYTSLKTKLQTEIMCFSKLLDLDIKTDFKNLLPRHEQLAILEPKLQMKQFLQNYELLKKAKSKELNHWRKTFNLMSSFLEEIVEFLNLTFYIPEAPQDVAQMYKTLFKLIKQYRSKNITKYEMAEQIKHISSFAQSFMPNIIDPLRHNVEYISNFMSSSNMSSKFDQLSQFTRNTTGMQILKAILFSGDNYRNKSCEEHLWDLVVDLESKDIDLPYFAEQQNTLSLLCPPLNVDHSITSLISEMKNCFEHELKPKVQDFMAVLDEIQSSLFKSFIGLYDELTQYAYEITKPKNIYDKNFATIFIFFKDLTTKTYVQLQAYSFWNLLCEIGGTLGLFLGASILTPFEILDFFILKPLFWKEEEKSERK